MADSNKQQTSQNLPQQLCHLCYQLPPNAAEGNNVQLISMQESQIQHFSQIHLVSRGKTSETALRPLWETKNSPLKPKCMKFIYQLFKQGDPPYLLSGRESLRFRSGSELIWCSNKCKFHCRLRTVFILNELRMKKGNKGNHC